ncbi:MAG: ribosome assembly cofactor RimP [Clostridium sp.]|nr:ribosome assembly cofactor RimP [Clostridium sp.]
MIDKAKLTEYVEKTLKALDGDNFLVSVKVTPENSITVEFDNMKGADLDTCAALNRAIETEFDRNEEDYELEVGSAGLTAPFTVAGQYLKNIGNPVDLLTRDGRKLHGTLQSLSDDAKSFVVTVPEKVREPGKKRPVVVETPMTFNVEDVKRITYRFE